MIIPPSFMPASAEEILDYYIAIDRAVGLPIILQDIPQGPIPPGQALRIADACRNVKYIKVETLPVTSKVAAMAIVSGEVWPPRNACGMMWRALAITAVMPSINTKPITNAENPARRAAARSPRPIA